MNALILAVGLLAQDGSLVASKEPGWPQWRGPRRDGISDERGLLKAWPDGGPPLLWKKDGLGAGYSSPIVSNGTIFITGDEGNALRITALDLQGKLRWKAENGRSWKRPYPGARSTCLYDGGRIYHLNAHGRVACLDAATGEERWSVDILKRFNGKNITWGLSECLVADGPRLIVTPGGASGAMAALDLESGRTVWRSAPIEPSRPGYASPLLFEWGGRRFLVNNSSRHLFGVDAETGKLLWKRHRPSEYQALCAIPVLCGDAVYTTTPGKNGGTLYRLKDGGDDVDTAWNTELDTLHGGAVLVDGFLYGSGYMGFRGWAKIDVGTGKPVHSTRDLKSGSAIYADGRIIVLTERGEAALLRPTPDAFEIASRFTLIERRAKDVWAHPVLCDGRLYFRYDDVLYCFDVRAK